MEERPGPWIVSPRWDGFWLLSGVWLAAGIASMGRGRALAIALTGAAHWMAEIGLAARIHGGGVEPAFARRSAGWALALVAWSAAAFAVIFRATLVPACVRAHELLFGTGDPIRAARLYREAFLGLFFGLAFKHYLYSAYVYQFRRPEIAGDVAPALALR